MENSIKDELIEAITRTETQFDEDLRSLTDEECDSVRLCCDVFRNDETLSTSQQYRRIRARIFLKDIYQKIGPEVLLLCMLTWAITTLGKFDPLVISPKLLGWWKNIPTKNGLRSAANKVCDDYGIKELIKKVQTYPAGADARASRRQQWLGTIEPEQIHLMTGLNNTSTLILYLHVRKNIPALIYRLLIDVYQAAVHSQTYNGQRTGPVVLKVDDIPELQISLLSDQHPQSVFDLQIAQLTGFLQQYQSTSSNPEQLARILNLFEGYQSICPLIQLVYPWYGSLPSIDIKIDSKIGWSANVQMSHRLAEELIEYIRSFTNVDVGSEGRRDSQQG
ncbi:unnamed protein product [Aspergillus oryzae]|nr:unnamed protein product [Aspergillus oryzae]